MRTLKFLSPALLGLALLGATAIAPAFAAVQGAETFRVVGLGRYGSLRLMNGPAEWSGVQLEIPAGACNLRATGVQEGPWVQVSYRAGNGYDYTGWVDGQYLAPDRPQTGGDYAGSINAPDYDAVPAPQYDSGLAYAQPFPRHRSPRAWFGGDRYGY